jgi:hypothetical protein
MVFGFTAESRSPSTGFPTLFLMAGDGISSRLTIAFWVPSVRSCDLRSKLQLVTWQELSDVLPRTMQAFLMQKYGIVPTGPFFV